MLFSLIWDLTMLVEIEKTDDPSMSDDQHLVILICSVDFFEEA